MSSKYDKSAKEVNDMLRYRFGDKERERSQRASGMHDLALGTRRRCPMRHDQIAWSGPPHDSIRCYVCLRCNAAASEPEIIDRGYTFDTIPDFAIHSILDEDLQRQATTNPTQFSPGFDPTRTN